MLLVQTEVHAALVFSTIILRVKEFAQLASQPTAINALLPPSVLAAILDMQMPRDTALLVTLLARDVKHVRSMN